MALFLFIVLPEFCSVLDVLEIVVLTSQILEDQRNFFLPFLLEFSKGVLSPAWGRRTLTIIGFEINQPIADLHMYGLGDIEE